ncbi:MAG: ABC transporter permease [Gemmatimonadaceae bacterium]
METLLQDFRYALRGLRRSPGFTLVALITLALGIGVNSSIFSVVNAILFRPLPIERPAELVNVYGHQATSNDHETISYPNYLAYRERTTTLSGVVAYSNFFAHLAIDGNSELVVGEIVSDNYFPLLGVRLALGRAFVPEEFAAEGALPVAIISDRMWRGRFGARTDVVGKQFRMNGVTYSVVGVAPADFRGMMPAVTAQMWIPTAMVEEVEPFGNQRTSGRPTGATRLEQRGRHWLWLKGRMKPGVSIGQVRAEFDGLSGRLATEFPETNAQERATVVPSRDVRINPDFDKTVASAGLVMVGAVALVLVVACANLANLLLARAAGRRREIAIRLALGAERGRLVRQLLTESMVLALAGGVVALPIAAWLASAMARVQMPLPIDLGLQITPDWRVLVFTLIAAVATGLVFGLIPAFRASRPNLVPALKGAANGSARRRFELRDALVVFQMAVSLVLVVGGALLVRSLAVAGRVELGYESDRLAQLSLALEMSGYDRDRGGRFLEAGLRRLEALPQVEAVALTSRLPLSLNNNGFALFIDGRQASESDRPFQIDGTHVDERYFQAMGLTLLAGRNIEAADRDQTRRVAVVTHAMAQRYWPGRPAAALGREFRLRWGAEPHTVIGVVEDYKVNTPGESPKPYLHLPFPRHESFGNYVVRTRGSAKEQVAMLQRELRVLDPELVFLDVGTLRDLADVRLFPVRAGAWLIGAFGVLALAVAAVGLYGVIGYSVSRRVREIGIRKALGAQPRQLVGMVLSEGMVLVAIGGAIGAALAAGAARVLSTVLFVGPFDAISFTIAFAVLALVALLANAVPARRAARVDPMIALRQE